MIIELATDADEFKRSNWEENHQATLPKRLTRYSQFGNLLSDLVKVKSKSTSCTSLYDKARYIGLGQQK